MPTKFDPTVQKAVELAKSATRSDEVLKLDTVFCALLHNDPYCNEFQYLADALARPEPIHENEQKLKTEDALKTALITSKDDEGNITGQKLFSTLLFFPILENRIPTQYRSLLKEAQNAYRLLEFRKSQEREKLVLKLGAFGQLLSEQNRAPVNLCGREEFIAPICRSLMKMMKNNALLLAPTGVGKLAIIKELARRVSMRDPQIPRSLHGAEIFQLSPEQLRTGVVSRPQFQNRVKQLTELLRQHPKIILVISPMDAVIAKDTRRNENIAAEEAIRDLVQSNIPTIATLGPTAYLLMDNRNEWDNLFDIYKIPEPQKERIVEILDAHVPEFQAHYNGLHIDKGSLNLVVEYAQQLYPNQSEPRRSVQFLDELCVRAYTTNPQINPLDQESIEQILSEPLFPNEVKIKYSEDELFTVLTQKIIGQSNVIRRLSSTITTRLSKWVTTDRPRGVFLLGGPTGVGKTETAVQLAAILGGASNNLIRVNCNTLQPTGSQKTSVIWPLLGVPAGYVGHGEGGLLSKIRENPRAIVLFDEFEKADPAVGKLLLQIIDTGLQRDNNGALLDFRQTFIIFTSNLGCDYEGESGLVGFAGSQARKIKSVPVVDEKQLRAELKVMGYGPEFLARIHHIFFFNALSEQAISQIIDQQIEILVNMLSNQGYHLQADPDFSMQMAQNYNPRDGVRGVMHQMRSDFTRSISNAEQSMELEEIESIVLKYGTAPRTRNNNQLIIYLHVHD